VAQRVVSRELRIEELDRPPEPRAHR
jgi:hypothetical protein